MIILGIDTSNYRTSVALFDTEKGLIADERQYLPVKQGEIGLRQSDAVFHHTRTLPVLLKKVFSDTGVIPDAVSVTTAPRDEEGSYMPCFTVGMAMADGIGAAMNIPVLRFSHQASHIAAAVYSSGKTELFEKEFIAFHVSGGTTEAVKVTPDSDRVFSVEIVAASLDLKAGQAIDRAGVMLGLPFPAGAELDKLSQKSEKRYKLHPSMKDGCPSISGLQNKCEQMLKKGEQPEDIAAYCIQYIVAVVDEMTYCLEEKFPGLPFVFSGGVMSNSEARKTIPCKHDAVFAEASYSSDNAVGTAVLASLKL